MKTIKLFASVFCVLFLTHLKAQTDIDNAKQTIITSANAVRVNAKSGKVILRTLAIDYFKNNNPNPDINTFSSRMEEVLNEAVDNTSGIYSSARKLDELNIDNNFTNYAREIEERADEARENLVYELVFNINNGNKQAARQAARQIRINLNAIIQLTKIIKEEAENLPLLFNVKVVFVEYGREFDASFYGFNLYATNQETGETYWGGGDRNLQYDSDTFMNLPAGEYVFSGYDRYFDGVSSVRVTLNENTTYTTVDGGEYVKVLLGYWSE